MNLAHPLRSHLSRLLAVSLLVASAACSRQVNTTPAAEIQHLLATDRAFAAASLENGTPDAFYANLAEDALELVADGAPVQGRAAAREHLRPLGMHVLSWTPQKAEVSAALDLGWTWGEWRLLTSARSGEVLARGKYLNVWKRGTDGSWKVAVDIGNSATPAEPAESSERSPDPEAQAGN